MVIADFYRLIQMAGAQFDILRPETSDTFKVYMAAPGSLRTEALMQDARQGDLESMFCRLNFDGQVFTAPRRGDRLSLSGEEYSIQQIQPRFGPGHELFGWRVRLRG
ncbi:MAG: hypothetical protein DRJ65_19835 [Acidobacteria bacterium]|nr:MAG: hypothetical protein DRJ65_19835 [Acidobacteriota bacterium]